jgi:hypothetical protein
MIYLGQTMKGHLLCHRMAKPMTQIVRPQHFDASLVSVLANQEPEPTPPRPKVEARM